MAIRTVTQPKFNVDTETEKASLITMADGVEVYVKSTGRSYTLQNGVFISSGKIVKNYTASEGETINGTIAYVAKLTSVFNAPENVEYQLNWYYEHCNDAANKTNDIQILLDGVEIGRNIDYVDAVGNYKCCSGFINLTLAAGNHTFIINFKISATGSGSNGRIKRARLDISKT